MMLEVHIQSAQHILIVNRATMLTIIPTMPDIREKNSPPGFSTPHILITTHIKNVSGVPQDRNQTSILPSPEIPQGFEP
jgi:hypothetical protein